MIPRLLKLCSNYLRLVLALILLAIGWFCFREAGYAAAERKWEAKWSARDEAEAKALAQREAAERTEEQRRQTAITRITQNAQQQITAARADADSAAAAGDRLQQTVAELQRNLRASNASRDTAIADAGTARAEAAAMLAQLLSESDEMAGAFSEAADRAYISGRACERAYDALMNK